MKLLAIDPGSNEVGLYWGPGTGRTLYLTDQSLKKHKRAATPRPERLASLAAQLASFIEEHGPFDFAAYEEQFVRGGGATKALFGAVGVIEAVLSTHFVGVISAPQSSTRKWAKGKTASAERDPKLLNLLLSGQLDPTGRPGALRTEHEADACVLYWYMKENGEVSGKTSGK